MLVGALPGVAGAQTSLWLDAALSSARPPAGAPQLETTNYGILGVRAETALQPFKLTGNLTGGHALESTSGRWLWAQAEAEHDWGKAGLYWLGYREEFTYSAAGLQVERDFRFWNEALLIRPSATLGYWDTGPTSTSYGVGGVRVEWNRSLREDVLLRLSGDAFYAGNNGLEAGGYGSVGADVYTVFRGTTIGAGVTQGFNPAGSETGYSLWLARPVNDNFRVDVQLAHTVADPVFGSPGSLGFTVAASWRFHNREGNTPPVLATVGTAVTRGRVVKFTVEAPTYARTVAVSGTFSDWRPVPLKREGKGWSGNVTIPAGTHQYVFLINGDQWYVPPNATDVVDDGFGRKNVTLVVRPK